MNFFEDELMKAAVQEVLHQQKASTTMLQRRFHIGYNRARRLIEHMEAAGITKTALIIVSPALGSIYEKSKLYDGE